MAYGLRIDFWDLKNGSIQQKIDVEHLYMECPDGYSKGLDDEPISNQRMLNSRLEDVMCLGAKPLRSYDFRYVLVAACPCV